MHHHHHEFWKPILENLSLIATIATPVVAFYALNTWKEQLKGKTNYQIARRYLKSALKLRDAIKQVRNPWMPVGEIQSALKEKGIEPKGGGTNIEETRIVYAKRWETVIEARTNLEAEILEAEVSWGDEARTVSKDLQNCVVSLYAILSIFMMHKLDLKDTNELYNKGNDDTDPDEFTKSVNSAIEKIENYLRPNLK